MNNEEGYKVIIKENYIEINRKISLKGGMFD
jgi:hypothetical protein